MTFFFALLILKAFVTLAEVSLTTHVVNHEMHHRLWDQVAHGLVDNRHVGVNQVADRLHLPLQLRIHAVHEVV